MKILFITPNIPYPPFRGDRLRAFNIINFFAKGNEIKIITFLKKTTELDAVENFRKLGFCIETVNLPKFRSMLNLYRSFLSSTPLQVSYYHSKEMYKKIFELTSQEKYDVVYFHLFNVAQFYRAIADATSIKVLDFTDATSLYLTRYLQFLKNPIKKLYFTFEKNKILNYEKITKNFDTLFVCSHVDKDFLTERKVHDNIQLFVNGINKDIYHYEYIKPHKHRIIFTGNMPFFPNKDAVLYFAKEIFPLVLERVPAAKFCVVGQNPPTEILELQSEKIIVTGFVEDIKKEYLFSEVNVAPIRFGAGTPNKITESLALGIPTVATSITVSGFLPEIKKYIFVADTPQLFADKVVNILNDSSIRTELMKEASETVTNILSWEKIISAIENYLQERIRRREKSTN